MATLTCRLGSTAKLYLLCGSTYDGSTYYGCTYLPAGQHYRGEVARALFN